MRVRLLNERNSVTVVLLHGLFTNSGFWLPYLDYLREYAICLLDFKYENLNKEKQEFEKWLVQYSSNKRVLCVIGHSFGATFLQSTNSDLGIPIISINPSHVGRKKAMSFSSHVAIRYSIEESKVKHYLQTLYNWVDNISITDDMVDELYVSNNDQFFDYSKVSFKQKVCIEGDHFNLFKAFELLVIKLKVKENNYVN